MKKLYFLVSLMIGSVSFGQTILTEWNFDSQSLSPSTGSGTISLIGGVAENTQSSCTCPYVSGNPNTGKSYTTKTYPAQGSASGTAGIQFNTSTVGQNNIFVYVDVYGSNTASKFVSLQYTTNGTTWTDAVPAFTVPYTTSSQWGTISYQMPATAENNANFAFRVVAVFDPATGNSYAALNPTSTYAVTGALRFDNIKVTSGALSVSQNEISGLQVYSNNNLLFVTSDSSNDKNVVVYDMLGKVVVNETVSSQPINVANLSSGAYIVKVTEDGKTATKKLVIQ